MRLFNQTRKDVQMKTATAIEGIPALDDFEPYVVEHNKYTALQLKLNELESRREVLVSSLCYRGGGTELSEADQVMSDALKILDGPVKVLEADQERLELRQELGQITDNLQVLRKAIAIQRAVLDRVVRTVSREAADKLKPAHRQLSRGFVLALLELVKSAAAQSRFQAAVRDAGFEGYSHILPHIGVSALSEMLSVRDLFGPRKEFTPNGALGAIFQEAIELRLTDVKEMKSILFD